MTLFESVFAGNDAVYGLTEGAINQAIEQYGADKAVSFPDTAYALPCYYAVTGVKVTTLAELKEALGVVKTLMTREKRTHDVFMSGVATALCAEFIEVLKYIDGAAPYEEPCYGHLADAVIRELGVPLVTGDIPGVAVILGKAKDAEEAAALFLEEKGIRILERNFRSYHGEIDIIALEKETILIVEVKMRRNKECGTPAEAVNLKKQKRICYTLNYYRMKKQLMDTTAVRFDVIEVDKDLQCHWIKNAFEFQE